MANVDKVIKDLVINEMSQEEFDAQKAAGTIVPNEIYLTPDKTVANFEKLNERIDTANEQINTANERIDTANERIDTKQDVTTAINYGHITNCITYIPQDIKLELNNGTLTLKAGSKVYVPNGFESNGITKKFDEITIESDITIRAGNNDTRLLFLETSSTGLDYMPIDLCYSGDTAPTGNQYILWYDTANNLMKQTIDSGASWKVVSLPLARVTTGAGVVASIDQVFNGFGYIGSIIFALPGVKGLIPNGRNADGSLNNIQFVVEKPLYQYISTTNRDVWSILRIENGEIALASTGTNIGGYNPNTNYNVFNGKNSISCIITREYFDSNGKITAFTPKTVFHAVDYNDFMNAIPAGIVAPFAGTTPPSGWLKCDGSAVSRERYADLFAAIGGIYGVGDGSTTFNLPTQSVLPLGTSAQVAVYGTSKSIQVTDGTNNASLAAGLAVGSNRVGVGTKVANLQKGDQTSGFAQLANDSTIGLKTSTAYGDSGIVGTADIANATGAKAIVCIKY